MSENTERKEKFTPGPWSEGWKDGLTGPRCAMTIWIRDSDGMQLDYKVISGTERRLICIIPSGEHGVGNEADDAALIAAAPDMYAALKAVMQIPHFHYDCKDTSCTHEDCDVTRMVVAAIKKARGES